MSAPRFPVWRSEKLTYSICEVNEMAYIRVESQLFPH